MFKKYVDNIKTHFKKVKELKKAKRYYRLIRAGGLFLEFIAKDLENMKNNNMNREARRRMEAYLQREGKLNSEMIKNYAAKVDDILKHIDEEMKKR